MPKLTKRIINKKLEIYLDDIIILEHSKDNPSVFVGNGREDILMYRGNFKITDLEDSKIPLYMFKEIENGIEFYYGEDSLTFIFNEDGDKCLFKLISKNNYSRFWIRIKADKDEHIYGLGEQMSHFNLRGKKFPIWTSEPGVGRNKNTYITYMSDSTGMSGGDYWNTNYPQPSYMSSKKYHLFSDSYAYSEFDFRNENFIEINVWEVPKQIIFWKENNFYKLMESFTEYFGRQPIIPDWINDGIIVGIQGGWEKINRVLETLKSYGVNIAGIWIQDWQGIRMTSFGQRLMWNWMKDEKRYPNFKDNVQKLKNEGIKFLAYCNCYLAIDGSLFKEASDLGYLAKNDKGEIYKVDFGEFYCGIPDFTREEVCKWFAKRILVKEMLDYGIDGWMADFGEYLPTDCILEQSTALKKHNEWPVLWAKVNDMALDMSGKKGNTFIFMRASGSKAQKYAPVLWAGDQSVDFSKDDGLATVIPAALSSCCSGFCYHHSDIGGYTSLFGNVRTPELNDRWIEFAAFTSTMRSHETNRPNDNIQIYDSSTSMVLLSKFVRIYKVLKDYRKEFMKDAKEKGISLIRPLFFEYEDDYDSYSIDYQYMLGSDILVAPVWKENCDNWEVYLPKDNWIHLWTDKEYLGGQNINIESPIGKIPVFFKKASKYSDLLRSLKYL